MYTDVEVHTVDGSVPAAPRLIFFRLPSPDSAFISASYFLNLQPSRPLDLQSRGLYNALFPLQGTAFHADRDVQHSNSIEQVRLTSKETSIRLFN